MKYKKEISFLLPMLCLMVLLAGCQERGSGTDGVVNNESEISQETQQNASDIDTADTEEVSLVNETETICEKTPVNLGEESESRIIVQRNIQEMEMSLTVYLTDGTSATIQYPIYTEKDYAYCETAYLQYDNKESIVLEIVNGTSNYGAAEYHVLHVEKGNNGFEIVEDATVLDGQYLEEASNRYSNSLIEFSDYTNTTFTNEENLITKRNNKPTVYISVWNSNTREVETYYLYYDQEWKISLAKLSIEKVKELSKKGEALTWSDFEQYENSGDIGSGLYVIRYDMEEPYYVLVGGADTGTLPMYIRLVSTQNPDNYIDIRTDDIDDFVTDDDDQEWKVESGDVDTHMSSSLDGVTMGVTEYSDTGVTVKIVNNTDKDIECGDDFYLEKQDEESGEWREPDTVIDSYGFYDTAHMIQKDSPYEVVIDFEWLYGKLEPGRYHIVKTITDFRGGVGRLYGLYIHSRIQYCILGSFPNGGASYMPEF